MRAWQSGIVVVVSAGNSGPLPQTVGVPGNIPYVITVGAMTDNYTSNKSDDSLASFSATGPTFEGFVKPDLVAPGGHVWSFMATYQKIAVDHPTFMNNGDFFTMSGTSQAAAAVSGVAALVIYNNPDLTPDQVKCRIIASGKPAVNADGSLAYSVLQQGTGLVDAKAAVYGTANNCANQGLNITADLNGTQHFMGRVTQDADGTFMVTSPNGTLWDQGAVGQQAILWETAYLWDDGLPVGRELSLARGIPVDRRDPVHLGHSLGGRISVDHRHGRRHDVADVRERLGRARIVSRGPLSTNKSEVSRAWLRPSRLSRASDNWRIVVELTQRQSATIHLHIDVRTCQSSGKNLSSSALAR